MDLATAAWLVALGVLVGLLVAPRPLPLVAAAATALLAGWPLAPRGFWGVAAVAAAAAVVATFANRLQRASRFAWRSSG